MDFLNTHAPTQRLPLYYSKTSMRLDAECEAMYYASLHYSITKHVHAIRQSVAEIIEEIAGRPVA